jgi:hypothetical protein
MVIGGQKDTRPHPDGTGAAEWIESAIHPVRRQLLPGGAESISIT